MGRNVKRRRSVARLILKNEKPLPGSVLPRKNLSIHPKLGSDLSSNPKLDEFVNRLVTHGMALVEMSLIAEDLIDPFRRVTAEEIRKRTSDYMDDVLLPDGGMRIDPGATVTFSANTPDSLQSCIIRAIEDEAEEERLDRLSELARTSEKTKRDEEYTRMRLALEQIAFEVSDDDDRPSRTTNELRAIAKRGLRKSILPRIPDNENPECWEHDGSEPSLRESLLKVDELEMDELRADRDSISFTDNRNPIETGREAMERLKQRDEQKEQTLTCPRLRTL